MAYSREARPLRADAVPDLSPALKSVLQEQPQYASWSPSQLCLYYMETVDVGALKVSERSPDKVPLLGIWSLAAADANGGARRDVILRLFTNTGRLERAGQVNGLDLRKIRGKVEEVENEDDPTAPPLGTRYELQLGKTVLIWDGRRVTDSTRASGTVTSEWRADSRRRGPMNARLALRPQWIKAMVGSLRIEGGDEFADAIKSSPVRFVAPAMLGGGGELTFGR